MDAEISDKDGPNSKLTFEQAFELTGHGKFNRWVLLTCGLIHLSVSMESVGIGYILPSAECDLELASSEKGLLNAAAFIGIMCTSFAWGYLGDTLGRRGIMLPALLASIVISVASAFSVNFWMFFALRILAGCLVSASSATVYAYLGEMHTTEHRASAMAWGAVFISFSFILLPTLAWIIVPGKWVWQIGSLHIVSWRAFILCWPVASAMAALALWRLPESPKFIWSRHGPNAALPILQQMYAANHDVSLKNYPVKEIIDSIEEDKIKSTKQDMRAALKGLALLLKMPLLQCVGIAYVSMFFVFMLSSGLYMWVPDLLNSLLVGRSEEGQTVCEIIYSKAHNYNVTAIETQESRQRCDVTIATEIFPISMAMGGVFALTYILIGVLISRIGKRILYGSIMVICGISCTCVWVVRGSISAGILLVVTLVCGTAASILAALTVDVYPTELRAMAMCGMYMVGRGGAAIGAGLLGVMLPTHCEAAFTVLGLSTAATTLLLLLWPKPEKVRKQLEQKGWTF